MAGRSNPRYSGFWALAIALTAYWIVFSAFIFHAYPLLLERGFDAQTVVFAMAVIGPAQVVGRMAIWVFASGVQIRVIGSLVVLAFPLVFLGLMVTPPVFPAVALIVATYGAANGIMTIVRGLVVPEMLTRDAYGAINGALAVPTIVAKAAVSHTPAKNRISECKCGARTKSGNPCRSPATKKGALSVARRRKR